jgi:hypothetical protein
LGFHVYGMIFGRLLLSGSRYSDHMLSSSNPIDTQAPFFGAKNSFSSAVEHELALSRCLGQFDVEQCLRENV